MPVCVQISKENAFDTGGLIAFWGIPREYVEIWVAVPNGVRLSVKFELNENKAYHIFLLIKHTF